MRTNMKQASRPDTCTTPDIQTEEGVGKMTVQLCGVEFLYLLIMSKSHIEGSSGLESIRQQELQSL